MAYAGCVRVVNFLCVEIRKLFFGGKWRLSIDFIGVFGKSRGAKSGSISAKIGAKGPFRGVISYGRSRT
jgi:hypothetical protein